MKDAVGKTHTVNEALDDLPEWREVLRGARQRWVAADPERRFAEELAKKFEKPLTGIGQAVDRISRTLNEAGRHSGTDDLEDD